MKAFLLAAGKGTRLRPLTDTIPKCLIPINGTPLLEIWINLLEHHQISEVLINTHHHAADVRQFIEQIQASVSIKITPVYEKTLLGSGGTVFQNMDFVANETDFIIAYADNLTDIDLGKMIQFHRACGKKDGILTMGLFRAADPKACGIATLDDARRIINFIEKPQHPESNLANSGIYIASTKIFDIISNINQTTSPLVFDFGFHVLPSLCGKMFGYEIKEYLRDVGTIESYHQALNEWPPERNSS